MISPPPSFSIRPADFNYCPAWREMGPTIVVSLDGNVLTDVIAYDADQRWVKRYRTDASGKVRLFAGDDGWVVMTEHLIGNVTLTWRRVAPDTLGMERLGT